MGFGAHTDPTDPTVFARLMGNLTDDSVGRFVWVLGFGLTQIPRISLTVFARLVRNLTEALWFVVFFGMKNIRPNFNKEFGLIFNCRFLIADCL